MRAWNPPEMSKLSVTAPPVSLYDTASGTRVTTAPEGPARLYVCGITPYDATHLGHAATYVGFDLLNRAWRNAGHDVRYVQNVTDVDDPLLERATKLGIDWVELAERETELFRHDMQALRVLPPTTYVGAVESIPLVIGLIKVLQSSGAIYQVEQDLYYSVSADPAFGAESGYDHETMLRLFAERGGDPEREGKRDPLDCVVWLGEREGDPSWPSPWGLGRPGWHIECAAIAVAHLGTDIDVQGGGSDLVFPHHEMCAGHAQVATPGTSFAQVYSHAGMVAYDSEKMSKSRGNLVLVSMLRTSDVDPMAIRLALLRHHFRSDWEWIDTELDNALVALEQWRKAVALGAGAPAAPVVDEVLAALADDLDAPRAVAAIDAWAAATLGVEARADTSDPTAAVEIAAVLDAALGVVL